jgi:hypothetical protein
MSRRENFGFGPRETQHWIVIYDHFAITGGVLSIFLKEILSKQINGPLYGVQKFNLLSHWGCVPFCEQTKSSRARKGVTLKTSISSRVKMFPFV